MPSRLTAAALAAVLALTACAEDGDTEDRAATGESALVPTFPPDTDGQDGGAPDEDHADDPAAPADHDEDAAPTETAPSEDDGQRVPAPDADGDRSAEADEDRAARDGDEPGPDAATEPTVGSSVTDPRRDTTAPLVGGAPDWADLVAGSVERTGTGDVTITVELAEPPQPPRSGTTMNVASFHDLTGDGRIDLEVWFNWSEDGWFASWRDNREGRAAYGDDAGLTLDHRGATLEAVVPAERFTDVTAWRWSLGLEWGRHEWLGSSNAAHDLAPDEAFVAHRG